MIFLPSDSAQLMLNLGLELSLVLLPMHFQARMQSGPAPLPTLAMAFARASFVRGRQGLAAVQRAIGGSSLDALAPSAWRRLSAAKDQIGAGSAPGTAYAMGPSSSSSRHLLTLLGFAGASIYGADDVLWAAASPDNGGLETDFKTEVPIHPQPDSDGDEDDDDDDDDGDQNKHFWFWFGNYFESQIRDSYIRLKIRQSRLNEKADQQHKTESELVRRGELLNEREAALARDEAFVAKEREDAMRAREELCRRQSELEVKEKVLITQEAKVSKKELEVAKKETDLKANEEIYREGKYQNDLERKVVRALFYDAPGGRRKKLLLAFVSDMRPSAAFTALGVLLILYELIDKPMLYNLHVANRVLTLYSQSKIKPLTDLIALADAQLKQEKDEEDARAEATAGSEAGGSSVPSTGAAGAS